jgi:glutathione S-transferase
VLRLITIPISHYCEKARWALDRAGLPFKEEGHVQVVHWFAVKRAGGKRTAPVLVTDQGVLPESGSIVGYAAHRAPTEQAFEPADVRERAGAVRLERWFDADLGPHTRRWAYFHLRGLKDMAHDYNLTGVPAWERVAFPVAFAPLVGVLERYLDVDEDTSAASRGRLEAVFDQVAERLDGREFLVGDRFSRADLSFACMAAPVLLPPQFGVPLPDLAELPDAWAQDAAALRAHPAGAFAMRMFAEYR